MARELNVRTPLFNRLTGLLIGTDDDTQREFEVGRTLDLDGLQRSVRRELELLFNTRSRLPAQRFVAPLTVIDYGIPSFSDFSVVNPEDRRALETVLRTAIEAFEPRLANVRVAVAVPASDGRALSVAIAGELIADTLRKPVSFDVETGGSAGKVTVE